MTDSARAEWTYDYQGRGLTRAVDPLNRVLLRARYDREGRVIEAGDSAGTSLYDYEFGSAGVPRRTVITDAGGAKTVFEHNALGAITAISDDEGQTARIEYNAANRPTHLSSSFGDEATFSYDARNRVTRQSSNNGAETNYTYEDRGLLASVAGASERTEYDYDARGNITAVKRNDPDTSYRIIRDGQGRLLSLRMENGREATAEYDAAGNETASTYTDMGRFETEYDAAGRVTAKRFPSGSSHRYEYDARGNLKEQSDDKGHATTIERDASGMITGIVVANRGWIRATRDETGRIIALSTSEGKSRRFTYNAKGALTGYTDEYGKRRTMKYDRRGRLRGIMESTGKRTEIERDKRGQITRYLAWDGQGHKYVYDQSGKLVSVKRASKPESLALESHGVSSGLFGRFWQAPDFAPDSECFFGSDFGGSILDAASYSCNDPFGEFGSGYGGGYDYGGGGGGGGGWDYFDPTTVDSECVKREEAACLEQFKACGSRALGEFIAEGIACLVIAITTDNLWAFILCMSGAIARVGGLMTRVQVAFNMTACEGEYRACKLRIPNTCRR